MQQKTQKCCQIHEKKLQDPTYPDETDTNADIMGISAELTWLQKRVTSLKEVKNGKSGYQIIKFQPTESIVTVT